MPKTTEQLAAAKAGSTAETNGFGGQERPLRPAGVYQLKDEDGNIVDEQITKNHALFGDSQAAAFERVGYKYLRPANPGEIITAEIAPPPAEAAASSTTADELKGLYARASEQERKAEEQAKIIADLQAQVSTSKQATASEVVTNESVAGDPLADADEALKKGATPTKNSK